MKTSETAIAAFGSHDYKRLVHRLDSSDFEDMEDVEEIEDITDEKIAKLAARLRSLIRKGKLYLMDKETGVAFEAEVVVGFKNGGLLIANDR